MSCWKSSTKDDALDLVGFVESERGVEEGGVGFGWYVYLMQGNSWCLLNKGVVVEE